MYNTILVPLDGSKRAEAILPHVEEVAHRYGAQIIFLQVLSLLPHVPGPHNVHHELRLETVKQAGKDAKEYLTAIRGEFWEKGIAAKTEIVYEPVVEAILNAAERYDVGLVAIASHGRTGLGHVFYGSVAAGVLHRADRPLLIIRSA